MFDVVQRSSFSLMLLAMSFAFCIVASRIVIVFSIIAIFFELSVV